MDTDLTNITQIWDVFFFPVLNSVLTYFFLLLLLGRKNILLFKERIFPKKDGKYCVWTYQLSSEGKLIRSYSIINDNFIILLQKPLSLIVIFLIFCFAFDRLIGAFSNLFPVSTSYLPDIILLRRIDEKVLAEIWSQYPNLDLDLLIYKIQSTQEINTEYSSLNIYIVVRFCGFISFFYLIICLLHFISKAISLIFSVVAHLILSLICIAGYALEHMPIKKVRNGEYPLLNVVCSTLRKIRKYFSALISKIFLQELEIILPILRSFILFSVSILMFVIFSFCAFKYYEGKLVSYFYLEMVTESEKYDLSDETTNYFLQKIEILKEDQDYSQLGLNFAFFIWDINIQRISTHYNFYKLPHEIQEFVFWLEDNFSYTL